MKRIFVFFMYSLAFNSYAYRETHQEKLATDRNFVKGEEGIKSCYRWMSWREMNGWIKYNSPQMYTLGEGYYRHLGRGGSSDRGVYCWRNPIGAVKGGHNEKYGDYLVRIDFTDDRVLWNRNFNTYHTNTGEVIPESEKKGVNSDVFYAYYLEDGKYWFQEYLIKDSASVKGFTFGDQALKDELRKFYNKDKKFELIFTDYHFPYTGYCPFESKAGEGSSWTYRHQNKKFVCYESRRYRDSKIENLELFWKNNPDTDRYYKR